MNGYIRRRSTDSWQVVIELGRDPVTGKRKRVSRNVVVRRETPRRSARRCFVSIETGTYVDPTRELVAEFLARWLRDYARPVVAPRTYERYEEIVRLHIVPTLGRVPLTQLRPTHIVAAERQWLDAGLSPATVLKHHRLIRQTLQQAMRWRVLTVNPADAVTPPRRERTEMSVLDRDQAAALLNAAQGSELRGSYPHGVVHGPSRRGTAWTALGRMSTSPRGSSGSSRQRSRSRVEASPTHSRRRIGPVERSRCPGR